MIALCAEHHRKADAGTFTPQQLRDFKVARVDAESVRGKFDWLRNELLAMVGGNLYHETLTLLTLDGSDVIWFNRDEQGHLLLNVRMRSLAQEARVKIEDNFWTSIGEPVDLKSPPSGKQLSIEYQNGDGLSVEFKEIKSAEVAFEKYQFDDLCEPNLVRYPVTIVEIKLKIGGTNINLNPQNTSYANGHVSGSS
jgi:hypothetical protein